MEMQVMNAVCVWLRQEAFVTSKRLMRPCSMCRPQQVLTGLDLLGWATMLRLMLKAE